MAETERRLKVLVAAYACNPYMGSEKGVGWGWVNAIAQDHEVWAMTDEIHRSDIERKISGDSERYKNIHFHYIPRTRWLWLEKIWQPSYLWTYQIWQKKAYTLGGRLHKEIGFDLAHQLTYVGYRNPGSLWKLNIPFVWGPIGGLENTPWRFLPLLGFNGLVYYAARNIINSLHKRFLVSARRAFQKADGGIIAATEGIRKEILKWYGLDSEVICEIGPPEEIATEHSQRRPDEPLRLVWSGLHDPAKALPLLLHAGAALPKKIDWQLNILGNGTCTKEWRRLAKRLGIAERCCWHGWVPRDKALAMMHKAHIFVITSLKDLTSTVLIEALSQGVPIICLNHCGFQNIVDDSCGIKIDVTTPHLISGDIREAIELLWNDEMFRKSLAEGALRRVHVVSWKGKSVMINKIYAKVVT
jgi:glycosyltransferase involved in cell wall biosynthesis